MQHIEPCFLTWIAHRRTREICSRLGFELAELVTTRRGLRRYAELITKTIRYLARRRPVVVLVQSPSMVLAVLTVMLRPLFKYRLIFDAHNEAVDPQLYSSAPVRAVSAWLMKVADAVIVTNPALENLVTRHGGKPIVLTDPIPQISSAVPPTSLGGYRIVLISTYADDEPFEAVIAASALLPKDISFYVTGNPARLSPEVRSSVPSNMTLTGYLDEHDYWNLLASSDAIMDLTTLADCLVCGAYEAIAVNKPIILSNNAASVATFEGFAEFADNTPDGIAKAITRLRSQHPHLMARFGAQKAAFEQRWSRQAEALLEFTRVQ